MEVTFLEIMGSVGGGLAVLAVIIFFMYKGMVEVMRKDRVYMEDRMSQHIDRYDKTCRENCEKYDQTARLQVDAQIKNTQVMTELTMLLKHMNGGKNG